MRDCSINLQNLIDYIEGRLDESTRDQIAIHLQSSCPRCAERYGFLETAVRTLPIATGMIAGPGVDAAKSLFRQRRESPDRAPLFAFLTFDGLQQPVLSGVRRGEAVTGGELDAYHRLYSTTFHDIDLWHEPQENAHWYIIGQVLPREPEQTVVLREARLTDSAGTQVTAVLDQGEFHFSEILEGVYLLTLWLADEVIQIPEVSVGR